MFTQISGRNFLPKTCGDVHPETALLQALCGALRSTVQNRAEKGTKALRRGDEEGWPAKGKKAKGRAKTGQETVTVTNIDLKTPEHCIAVIP